MSQHKGVFRLHLNIDLKDISSFSVALANTIKLVTTGNVQHKVTGMFNKKLIQALLEAGVSQK